MNRLRFYILGLLAALSVTLSLPLKADFSKPFYKHYKAENYHAHSRNFDVTCDDKGRTIVANFEGILLYDNSEWRTLHTPGVSRVLRLYKQKSSGNIWFGGYNVIGYLDEDLNAQYIVSDKDTIMHFDEVNNIYELDGKMLFETSSGKKLELRGRNVVPYQMEMNAYHTFCVQDDVREDVSGRLDSIANEVLPTIGIKNHNAIASDGKGSVWVATDDGLYRVWTDTPYSYFDQDNGLHGNVNTFFRIGTVIGVGTMDGPFLYFTTEGGKFHHIGSKFACWSLSPGAGTEVLCSKTDGLFKFNQANGQVTKLTDRNTLSAHLAPDGRIYTGELDGLYCDNELVAPIPRVVRIDVDSVGTIWIKTLYEEVFRKKTDDKYFHNCTDEEKGYFDNNEEELSELGVWAKPFIGQNYRAIMAMVNNVWVAQGERIYRLNKAYARTHDIPEGKVYIRYFRHDNRNVLFGFSMDKVDPIGEPRYSYRVSDDSPWSEWSTDNTIELYRLTYGSYNLTTRVRDAYNNIYESESIEFYVPYPVYLRWYAWILYVVLLVLLILLVLYRLEKGKREKLLKLQAEKERLDYLVAERTKELEETQKQMLRQTKQAAVGNLTQGLIDRILNPLNYINNFSRLSAGQVRDLQGDLDDIDDALQDIPEVKENDDLIDVLEDSRDVMQMLSGNLQKIESHGVSVTRILKAMEELLRDRSGQQQPTDINTIIQQDVEMCNTYYAKQIQEHKIQLEWTPAEPVIVNVVAAQISNMLTSIMGNAIYAVGKRSDMMKAKQPAADYLPKVEIKTSTADGMLKLQIRDNGIGIEESIIAKIFEPFFSTKPTGEAPGVGLYLAQQIVQDHQGTISVDSKKEEYTEFTILLPIAK